MKSAEISENTKYVFFEKPVFSAESWVFLTGPTFFWVFEAPGRHLKLTIVGWLTCQTRSTFFFDQGELEGKLLNTTETLIHGLSS